MPVGSQLYCSRDITTAFGVLDLNLRPDSAPISPSPRSLRTRVSQCLHADLALKLFLRLLFGIFFRGPLLPPSDEELIVRCIQTSQRTRHYTQLLISAGSCLQLLFHSR